MADCTWIPQACQATRLRRRNPTDVFSLREADYWGGPQGIEKRLNQIIVAADYAERDDPLKTPPLP